MKKQREHGGKNVSPPGQKLHSRCHFSAEEYPEEKKTAQSLSKENEL